MVYLEEIERFLHETLGADALADYAPNGIQVAGSREIRVVATGVSACMALFEKGAQCEADLILVHHGLFWEKDSRVIAGSLRERLKYLLMRDMALAAYHLPLDCHGELGNNALLLDKLGLERGAPFGLYRGTPLSFLGQPRSGSLSIEGMTGRIREVIGGEPLVLPFGPERIQKIAIVSGAAPELIREAVAVGADLFITGEATEWVYHYALEEGIHFIAAGHHRTERFGIQAVGDLLASRFGLVHHHYDVPNPI
ncbi:MAG: Nif3-like dinuclear metal center hexameric protein [Magnetococcales bacterium]|nr:Nif3-like dinuclear metal center hexameric protein [Magnetococcales bacterium]